MSPAPQDHKVTRMKRIHTALLAMLLGSALLAGCERPSMESSQIGNRGLAMGQVVNPRIAGPIAAAQVLPAAIPALPSPPGSPLAKTTYQNVQVLGDLTATEFTRTMLAITAWVAPQQGCAYCHAEGEALSSDKLYTKVVARKMLQMTRHINSDWANHVAATGPSGAGGVTCYTCHRGAPVPDKIWFTDPGPKQAGGSTTQSNGQNHPSVAAAYSALGLDPLTPYLLGAEPIRAASTTALPGKGDERNPAGIRQTENTFALMMHMSTSLGVNCTFCHNTRSHAEWAGSPPQRTTAFYGIRMARDLNNAYMLPLTGTFPANRLGPTGDVAKISCATCHQALNKPLNGAQLAKDHAAALGVASTAAVALPVAAAMADGLPGKVTFEVGKSDLGAEFAKVIATASAALKADPTLKLVLSGFADKSGNADKNLELARQRALAVRDALKASGVTEDRIQLKKPEFVVGGSDADARRVDISLAS